MDLVPENQTNENQVNKDEVQLNDNQVKLSDGRVVTVREALGNDEMILAAQLGNVYEPNASGYTILRSCLVARCVEKVDDKTVLAMKKFSEYRDFMGQFKAKDWDKVVALFNQINTDVVPDEKEGNPSEGE